MIVAVIYNEKVENLIVCDTVELAQALIPGKVCIDGEGLSIGDDYPADDAGEVKAGDAE